MASIITDEAIGDDFDAADAFMKRWADEDATEPSDTDSDDHPEEDDEDGEADEADAEDDQEDEEDGEDPDDEDKPAPKTKAAADDAEVEVTVNGETHKVSVANLKRLYGQEAALTHKSQEVAAMRKQTEELSTKYTHGIQSLLTKAEKAVQEYTNIDWPLAAAKMDTDAYKELRADAKQAYDEYNWLKGELETGTQAAQARQNEALKAQAIEATRVLSDPVDGIPGWGDKLYNEIRAYAVSQGFKSAEVDRYVDPAVFKILHKAMELDKAKTTANVKKKDMTPTKVVTKNAATPAPKSSNGKVSTDKLEKRLKATGGTDDAINLFEARLSRRK